jgi:uncharacterized membrane protein YdjX (TVP38/TMEM64 family)
MRDVLFLIIVALLIGVLGVVSAVVIGQTYSIWEALNITNTYATNMVNSALQSTQILFQFLPVIVIALAAVVIFTAFYGIYKVFVGGGGGRGGGGG